jgi:K+-sensing histidine kinase KdpD
MESGRTKTNWRAIALVTAGIALTSAGHYFTPSGQMMWHGVFQRLYYLPVVFAAITFGWVGGLVAALAAGVAYIPHIMITWSGMHHYAMEQYTEIFMFLAVGVVTGILADRERKRDRSIGSRAGPRDPEPARQHRRRSRGAGRRRRST